MEIIGLLTALIIPLILVVFYLFCFMKIYSKAGEPMWKAIIPIYSQYVLCKIAWKGSVFFRMLVWSILTFVFTGTANMIAYDIEIGASASAASAGLIASALGLVFAILQLILSIRITHHLSKAFGHGVGMTLLLIFLPIIGLPILAFGSSIYVKDYSEETEAGAPIERDESKPGSDLYGPMTDAEKRILNQIRQKKSAGDYNFTEVEKAVLYKLKAQKKLEGK